MKKIYLAARILLGTIFLLAGADGLTMMITGKGFMPAAPPSGALLVVMNGITAMIYLFPAVKILEISAAILLILNKKVNLALVMLGPIVFNIVGIHLFVDRAGLPVAIVVLVLFSFVMCSKCEDFKTLLSK